MTANTSLNTNLNVDPYYDDYSVDKNFYRILFRPGQAVQARELTQLQTMLQKQVDLFGEHVFKEGSIVSGCEFKIDLDYGYVRVKDNNSAGATATSTMFVGQRITGGTSGVTAYVDSFVAGTEAQTPDTNTLFVKYIASGPAGATVFSAGETLTTTTGTTYSVDVLTGSSVGDASNFKIGEGIVFAKDHFVRFPESSLLLEKSSATPSYRVGYDIVESIVTSDTDNTLLDPAAGAYNYSAPGANRLKLLPTLKKVALTETVTDNSFYELFRIENGVVTKRNDKTQYEKIRDELARRTFDESGNYVVSGLNVRLRENLNDGTNLGYLTSGDGGDVNKLSVGVESGKAYVLGYDFENVDTKYLTVSKGTDFVTEEERSVSANFGNYVLVSNAIGIWGIDQANTVQLRDAEQNAATASAATSGNVIGSARIRAVKPESGTLGSGAATYRLYLYDIEMTGGSFANVAGITQQHTAGSNTFADLTNTTIYESDFNTSLFKLPADYTKTIRDGTGVIDTEFVYQKLFNVSFDGTGVATITTPSTDDIFVNSVGALSSTQAKENFQLVFDDTGIVGDITAATVNIATTTSATITNAGWASRTGRLIVNLKKTTAREKQKVIKTSRYVAVDTTAAANTTGPWDLGFSDVFELENVWTDTAAIASVAAADDNTELFELDNGQRDNLYKHGQLKLKKGSTLPAGHTDILVKLSYFEHDTTLGNGYLSVDSYPIDDVNTANTDAIQTQEIPIYTSPTTGKRYDLRDHIDIRPRVADTATDSTTIAGASTNPVAESNIAVPVLGLNYPTPNENFELDFQYYLARKDVVVLNSRGDLSVLSGTPSTVPEYPPVPTDSLPIARLDVTPYPSLAPNVAKKASRPDLSSSIKKVDNKRFTMKEIGELRDRVDSLEYYTSLSLLESTAKEETFTDSAGNDRFKNGILTDSFTGHNVGDVYNSDYSIAVDPERQEIRPRYKQYHVDFDYSNTSVNIVNQTKDIVLTANTLNVEQFAAGETVFVGATVGSASATGKVVYAKGEKLLLDTTTGTFAANTTLTGATTGASANVQDVFQQAAGDLSTLPFTNKKYAEQVYSNTKRQVSGLIYDFNSAVLELTPETDTWQASTIGPDVQVNFGGNLDNYENLEDTEGTEWGAWSTRWSGKSSKPNKDKISVTVKPETITDSVGEFIVDNTVVPFMRGRQLTFKGYGFKPSTRLYAFFDGENVSTYVTPEGGVEGGTLTSDSKGEVNGTFRVPNEEGLRFRTGTKQFKLTASSTNATTTKTSGVTQYTAKGVVGKQKETILSTRDPAIVAKQGTDRKPLAQTFFVDVEENVAGVFVSRLNLYFQQVDGSLPFTVQLREVDSTSQGLTDNVVPFSTVTLYPDDLQASSTGDKPSTFTFKSPVFLKNKAEYAIVMFSAGESPDYYVWSGKLGGNDQLTEARISKQPYVGTMFAASNNKEFSEIVDEVVKFEIYRCSFDSTVVGTYNAVNESIDFLSVNKPSVDFVEGEKVTFFDAGGVAQSNGTVSYFNKNLANTALYIEGTTNPVTSAMYVTGLTSGANTEIDSVDDATINVVDLEAQTLGFVGTSQGWAIKPSTTTAVHSAFIDINNQVDTVFTTPYFVKSRSNESVVLSGAKSLTLKGTLETDTSYLSPAVDQQRTYAAVIENYVNNDDTNEDSNAGGSSLARYISRAVTLEEDQDAEDLKVVLEAYKPSTSNIKVYYKALNNSDSDLLIDRDWVEMTQETLTTLRSSDNNLDDFKTFQFGVPTANLTGASGEVQYDNSSGVTFTGFKYFAVKIVLLSTTTSNVPRVRDLKVTALQI